MPDRLTQLQDCLDDLLTQMYASLSYIQTRHPYGQIAGQPSQAPKPKQGPTSTSKDGATSALINGDATHAAPADIADERPKTPPPETPDRFEDALHELARDLVLKEQQIEILINSLPGLGMEEQHQGRKIKELEAELRQVEKERAMAEEEKEEMVEMLGQMIVGIKRVP